MNEKLLSVASHASVLCTSVFGVFAIPLLIMLLGPSEIVKQNAREALNVHLNVLLVSLVFAIFICLATLFICAVAVPAGIQMDSLGNQINDSIRIGVSLNGWEIANGVGAFGAVLGTMVVCTVLIALVYALWFAVYAFVLPLVAICAVANDSNKRVFRYPLMFPFLPDRLRVRTL